MCRNDFGGLSSAQLKTCNRTIIFHFSFGCFKSTFYFNSRNCANLLVFCVFRFKLPMLRVLLLLCCDGQMEPLRVIVVAVQQFAVGYLLQRLSIGLCDLVLIAQCSARSGSGVETSSSPWCIVRMTPCSRSSM